MTNASENGPRAGEFRLTRSGPVASALTVNLQVTGSAANGVDYIFVSPQVNFLAGERAVSIQIAPYVDTLTELSEVVDAVVLPGTGWPRPATSAT